MASARKTGDQAVSIAMEGCGPKSRVYSSAEYETLAAELAEIKNSMAYRTSLIGRLEAELDTIKAGQGEQKPAGYVCGHALGCMQNGRMGAQEISMVYQPSMYRNKPLYTTPQPAQDVMGLVRVLKSLSRWIELLPIPTTAATSKLMMIDETLAKFERGL